MAVLNLGNVIGPEGPMGPTGPAGPNGPNLINAETTTTLPAGTLLSSNGSNIEGKLEKDLSVAESQKSIMDGNNQVIAETYATKADTYTKAEVDSKVSSVYNYKGSVPTFNDLPKEGNEVGDVYDVAENGENYAWDGASWDSLGSKINLDGYLKKE